MSAPARRFVARLTLVLVLAGGALYGQHLHEQRCPDVQISQNCP